MSRPIVADRERSAEAAKWHRDVFKAWGNQCIFCNARATDAMHVIPRSLLGPLRYAIPVQNGRPGCRRCHDDVDAGRKAWPLGILRPAIAAHNRIAKVPIVQPPAAMRVRAKCENPAGDDLVCNNVRGHKGKCGWTSLREVGA